MDVNSLHFVANHTMELYNFLDDDYNNGTQWNNSTYYGAKAKFLSTFSEIYIQLIIWATATIGAAFFFAGCWGARLSKRKSRCLWLPLAALLMGCIFGVVQAIIISSIISAIFMSVPYPVGIDMAAAIGIAQGLIFLYFHLGRADFIHS